MTILPLYLGCDIHKQASNETFHLMLKECEIGTWSAWLIWRKKKKKKKKGLQMARSTNKDAQALFNSLRSAYAATPTTLKVSWLLFITCSSLLWL